MSVHGDRDRFDVIVVGAGMVGGCLAAALGRAGLRVAVVDREAPATLTDAAFDGRTSAIAHGSMRILEGSGIWPALVEHAEPILDIRVSDGGSPLFLHYDHTEVGDLPLGYIVENRRLRQAVFDHLGAADGVALLAPAAVASVERDGAAARVYLAGGRTLTAPLVVAADGRNSRLRRDAGIVVSEWSYRQTAIVCVAQHERPHRGVAHERFLPSGPFAILPMRDAEPGEAGPDGGLHRSSIVWSERADLAPRLLGLDQAAFDAELRRRFGDFCGAVRAVGPRWSYPLSVLNAARYVAPRLALAGDAAHAIHPIAGQGLNLGVRDVAALAEVVVEARRLGLDIGSEAVLQRYERWRRFDSLTLVAVTDGLNRLFSNDVAPLRWARDLGLGAVNRLPPLRRLFMRHAMGTVGILPRLARGEPL